MVSPLDPVLFSVWNGHATCGGGQSLRGVRRERAITTRFWAMQLRPKGCPRSRIPTTGSRVRRKNHGSVISPTRPLLPSGVFQPVEQLNPSRGQPRGQRHILPPSRRFPPPRGMPNLRPGPSRPHLSCGFARWTSVAPLMVGAERRPYYTACALKRPFCECFFPQPKR